MPSPRAGARHRGAARTAPRGAAPPGPSAALPAGPAPASARPSTGSRSGPARAGHGRPPVQRSAAAGAPAPGRTSRHPRRTRGPPSARRSPAPPRPAHRLPARTHQQLAAPAGSLHTAGLRPRVPQPRPEQPELLDPHRQSRPVRPHQRRNNASENAVFRCRTGAVATALVSRPLLDGHVASR